MSNTPNSELLLSFYGDDFTGSTDAMECLTLNGIPAALFLLPPSAKEVYNLKLKQKVAGTKLQAFGVPGIARSLNPQEMEGELRPVFEQLSKIPTRFFHYKICSTLDSAPHIGNIGRATEIAEKYFKADNIPFLVGAPFLNRFVIFGNLFARIGTETFRLDRHPVMSQHPVTPMNESDIAMHLSRQSSRKMNSFDLHALAMDKTSRYQHHQNLINDKGEYILFDTFSYEDLCKVGELLIQHYMGPSQLLVGSSGIEYALALHLQETGIVQKPIHFPSPGKAKRMLVMSGSCSPITNRQIEYAIQQGFEGIGINVTNLIHEAQRAEEIERVVSRALSAFDRETMPMIYSARGPKDPSIHALRAKLPEGVHSSQLLGGAQGMMVKRILESVGKTRVVVAGGDTSGYVTRALGIYALETLYPIAPGAPLCIAHARNSAFDGLEISLKGGQNGKEDYFIHCSLSKVLG